MTKNCREHILCGIVSPQKLWDTSKTWNGTRKQIVLVTANFICICLLSLLSFLPYVFFYCYSSSFSASQSPLDTRSLDPTCSKSIRFLLFRRFYFLFTQLIMQVYAHFSITYKLLYRGSSTSTSKVSSNFFAHNIQRSHLKIYFSRWYVQYSKQRTTKKSRVQNNAYF